MKAKVIKDGTKTVDRFHGFPIGTIVDAEPLEKGFVCTNVGPMESTWSGQGFYPPGSFEQFLHAEHLQFIEGE